MNLRQLLQHFTLQLRDIYDAEEVASIFNLATGHVSGLNRAELSLAKDRKLTMAETHRYAAILKALESGRPIQYILGETEFYGLPFKVNPAVLIPRPETEELVEWVLESCALTVATGGKMRILDIGTGSGCIAVSLKKNLPGFEVFALDVSKAAIETATANASLNELDILFIEADIRRYSTKQKFDLMVSNPPYVTLKEQAEMHENVLAHEPHLALFVADEKPLEFYEAIADFAQVHLSDMGLLFFEINANLGQETVEMLTTKSFINIELKKDMQGKDRMIRCRRGQPV
ncbi:peptide chain release factor N(5)-glutamine methyltransferase [Pedobacter africanus]|uniref:Release factor glutamine methyltransferase n=1 Tax=Pedobacter africanus TaxID=151894 RepID=A0A1W2DL58_9SPHI|nr:peptide chain release factor N(5)-glutamine methyltransferase [Pedobacter africanus]SMC97736.1 release factor glutamine methyltransferase [Pedobacter africanus]